MGSDDVIPDSHGDYDGIPDSQDFDDDSFADTDTLEAMLCFMQESLQASEWNASPLLDAQFKSIASFDIEARPIFPIAPTCHASQLPLCCVPSNDPRNKPSTGIDVSVIADDDPHNIACIAVDLSTIADDDPSKCPEGDPFACLSYNELCTPVCAPIEFGPIAIDLPQAPSSSAPLVTPSGEPSFDEQALSHHALVSIPDLNRPSTPVKYLLKSSIYDAFQPPE